jgi:hypothetical protein
MPTEWRFAVKKNMKNSGHIILCCLLFSVVGCSECLAFRRNFIEASMSSGSRWICANFVDDSGATIKNTRVIARMSSAQILPIKSSLECPPTGDLP